MTEPLRKSNFPIMYEKFEDDKFIEQHKADYDLYIDHRVRGYHASIALRRVFGEVNADQNILKRIDAIESTPYYQNGFKQRLKEIAIEDLWNTKQSLHELLCLTRNPVYKESVRLNALKELNVMCGIIVVDETGKSRKGTSLADFYGSHGAAVPGTPDTSAKH